MLKWWRRRNDSRSPQRNDPTRQPMSTRRTDRSVRGSFRNRSKAHNDSQASVVPPMPSETELNEQFAKVVSELDLSADKREVMMGLPPDKKWQIIVSNDQSNKMAGEGEEGGAFGNSADGYLEEFQKLAALPFTHDINELSKRAKTVNHLKTALRTQPNRFVMRFIEIQGLEVIFDFLNKMDYDYRSSVIHTSVVGCIKAIMNNSHGRSHVLMHPRSIRIISQSLQCDNPKATIAALEILAAVCLVPDGHKKVLVGMSYFQKFAYERTRFQTIVNDLDRSSNHTTEDVSFQTTIMTFINAVLSYGPGEDSLEFRVHLRYEFLMLGLEPIVEKLRQQNNELVRKHLEFFSSTRQQDEEAIASRFNQLHLDSRSATSLVKALQAKLSHSGSYPHFLSILNHLLLVPDERRTLRYQLISKVVQQIVLQEEDHENQPYDPDAKPLVISVDDIIKHLASENELVELRNTLNRKAEALEETKGELGKKERECEVRMQEKEDIKAAMNKVMQRLEKENATVRDSKQREKELSGELEEARALYERERADRKKIMDYLEKACTGLPDSGKADAKKLLEDLKTSASAPLPSPTGSAPSAAPAPPPPPPPAPPGMGGGPPPPPPPPGAPPGPPPPPGGPPGPPGAPPPPGGFGAAARLPAKKIPKSGVQLKSFNWSKIPDIKIEKTIWKDLNETRLIKEVDLKEVDSTFAAFQKDRSQSVSHSLTRPKEKEVVTLVDSRRAQNLTILLSRMKTSYEEIKLLVLQMDEEEIGVDMLEQLIKYTPQSDEMELLESHSHGEEIERFSTADRFLFEVGRIPHYKQRLETLYFKRKFPDLVSELRPKIESLTDASQQVQKSQKLRKMLELILLLGNYMNTGMRGNAYGFRISSLTKLVDTKSGAGGARYTLLNFTVQVIQDKFPELMAIEGDLSHIAEACRCSMPDIEKDVGKLQLGLSEVKKELDYQAKQPSRSLGDRYVELMGEFVAFAGNVFADVESQIKTMKDEYLKTVDLFGEDSKMPSEEFFDIFNTFLNQFSDSRAENIAAKKKTEEEEKKQRQQEESKQREKEIKAKRKARHAAKAAGEFDDLVTALRSGDLFEKKENGDKKGVKAPPVARKFPGSRSRHDDNTRDRH